MNVKLKRPLVFLDIEGTGANPEEDRIIELSMVTFEPKLATPTRITQRFRPLIPISAGAIAVHGITDGMVAVEDTFETHAEALFDHLVQSDYGGFNVVGYDLPILEAEFARCSLAFDWSEANVVDAYKIMVQREQRTLKAALRFYCCRELEDAHAASADVDASIDVVRAQIDRYGIAATPAALDEAGRQPDAIDRQARFVREDGVIVFGFGKYKGSPAMSSPDYLRWMLRQSFSSETKRVVREIVSGRLV